MGYIYGLVAIVVLWLLSKAITGDSNPLALAYSAGEANGGKKVLSASKTQAWMWTVVIVFVYMSLVGFRIHRPPENGMALADQIRETSSEEQGTTSNGDERPFLPNFPLELLILMGLSVTTAVGSKGVTVSYISQKRVGEQAGGLFTNPDSSGNLAKTQMLIWTFITAAIYIYTVIELIARREYFLPPIDPALLVLMGVSQGAYVGDKLAAREIKKTPRIKTLIPEQGSPGSPLTIMGEGFGDSPDNGLVVLGDTTVSSTEDGLKHWDNLRIELTVPSSLKPGIKSVCVWRDGEQSAAYIYKVEESTGGE